LILKWFHESLSAYSLKELEKAIPGVSGINQAQVKEYIQTLTDEGLLRVEKIGSGNWYWAFLSDAKKTKERVLNDLTTENTKLETSITEIERQIEDEMERREDDEEMLENGGMDRAALLEVHTALLKKHEALERELGGYSDNDPTEVLHKANKTKLLMESAERWTDNLDSLQAYTLKLTGGDRSAVAQMMHSVCGDEYVLGEGLKEL
jgi:hypothetical protein